MGWRELLEGKVELALPVVVRVVVGEDEIGSACCRPETRRRGLEDEVETCTDQIIDLGGRAYIYLGKAVL